MANGLTRIEMDTMRAIESMNRKMKDQRKVDWEQRRYEVAREIFTKNISPNTDMPDEWIQSQAKLAIRATDALIAELKKGGEE